MSGSGAVTTTTTPEARLGFARIYAQPRFLSLLALGFLSGLPLALTGRTLTMWMSRAHVDLSTIGLFSALPLPYALKFLWAPLLDRYAIPLLGRRRGWAALLQLLLAVALLVLGSLDPAGDLSLVASAAVTVAFLSASQDIVLDAYRTDLLEPHERAAASAVWVTGYRLAMLTSGALVVVLSDHASWRTLYGAMAALMALGVVVTVLAPEPTRPAAAPTSLVDAIVLPLREVAARKGVLVVLVFLITFKLGESFQNAMIQPFLVSLQFTSAEIGVLDGGLSLAATLLGGLFAGAWLARMPLRTGLLVFGGLQALTHVAYVTLALAGKSEVLLIVAVVVENLAASFATTALVSFMLGLCDRRYSAAQFALFSSIAAFGGRITGAGSGALAQALGWPGFFAVTIALALPGLLCVWFLPSSTVVPPTSKPEEAT